MYWHRRLQCRRRTWSTRGCRTHTRPGPRSACSPHDIDGCPIPNDQRRGRVPAGQSPSAYACPLRRRGLVLLVTGDLKHAIENQFIRLAASSNKAAADMALGRCWTWRPAAPRPTAGSPPGAWGGHVTGSAERGGRPSRTGGASCGHRRARQSRPVTTAPNVRHEHATRHRIAAETFCARWRPTQGGGSRRPGRDVATSARR
jgi:hypothetical protein